MGPLRGKEGVMGRDPEYLAFVRRMAELPPPEDASVAGMRADARRAMAELPRLTVGEVRDVDAGGVPARLYRPEGRDDGPVVVYLHGGGWVIGDVESYDPVVRALVAASGVAFLSVDYRLAPEHPYPAAVDDAERAVRWALSRFDEVGVAGESAGGQIAVSCLLRGVRGPSRLTLIYPALDLRVFPDPLPDPDGIPFAPGGPNQSLDAYVAGTDPADPGLSPLLAPDLSSLPPTLLALAEFDRLRPQGEAFARRLEEAGVPTTVHPGRGLDHGWMSWFPYARAPERALEEVGRQMGGHFTRV
ncbi:alpha/beta hydrolase [Actinocorallia longicatena]|uniref:alpha/beta hydrolase n=1 Tax=Actinocorallia longicatena TaxID=111803 RepID=UPI003CD098F9